jgi:hypothetical protein
MNAPGSLLKGAIAGSTLPAILCAVLTLTVVTMARLRACP